MARSSLTVAHLVWWSQVAGITDAGLDARPIKTVAVLGGGLMGSGIATASLIAGAKVILKEVNDKFLQVEAARLA